METQQFEELMQKIGVLIHLQTAELIKDKTLRESIAMLNQAGLGPSKIAEILGKKPKYISKELNLIRKQKVS